MEFTHIVLLDITEIGEYMLVGEYLPSDICWSHGDIFLTPSFFLHIFWWIFYFVFTPTYGNHPHYSGLNEVKIHFKKKMK